MRRQRPDEDSIGVATCGRPNSDKVFAIYFGPTETRWKLGYHRVVCLFGPPS